MTEKDSGTSFLVGLLIGTAAGLAVGFLYAPRPGKETRAMLREKAEVAAEKAREATEKAKQAAAEARGKVEEKLHREKTAE